MLICDLKSYLWINSGYDTTLLKVSVLSTILHAAHQKKQPSFQCIIMHSVL